MDRLDLIRELEKISDTLGWADQHFQSEANMNAALHLSEVVRPAPLATSVATAHDALGRLIGILKEGDHG